MKQNNKSSTGNSENRQHPLPGEINHTDKQAARQAHDQAEADMGSDAERTAHSSNDKLDEAETARLGEQTDLV